MPSGSVICIVDDDESVRESLVGLLGSLGYETESFVSAEEFLTSSERSSIGCVLLDATMPGMSGTELQQHLLNEGRRIPIVFITARTEEELCARLMEYGTVACLTKPFTEEDLLVAVTAAIASVAAES